MHIRPRLTACFCCDLVVVIESGDGPLLPPRQVDGSRSADTLVKHIGTGPLRPMVHGSGVDASPGAGSRP